MRGLQDRHEFFKHPCLVCLAHFSVLAINYNCFFKYIYCTKRYLKFCFIVNLSFFSELCKRSAFLSYKLITTVTVRRRVCRKTFCKESSFSEKKTFFRKKNRKNKYVIHRLRSVRIEKNCALGLEYVSWPAASGRTQDLRHSLSLYGPPSR